ncbi:NUDIX domain-containing protein [Kitasatospora sp. NPDC059795]|uniref:NUDIX domain-containing protein n=1 Tax=unclassified Kitasatospora TaxID=2633591 RepID=UPI00093D9F7F|nr:NUDIX domain-containing protein [Kitasatospora sp. CB01950]OKJ16264.1 NUDIX hydrolase [Kitasatospora sp. CB01950]
MRWKVYGERPVYQDPWLNVWVADVELPDGKRFDHHLVKLRDLAVAAVVNDRSEVLMLWRHRFITDTWAWELPMGLVEAGEDPAAAAAREALEETGWRVSGVRPLIYAQPAAGITDSEHFVFRADPVELTGPPTEQNESDRIAWVPLADLRGMIARREIVSSATLVGVLALLLDATP